MTDQLGVFATVLFAATAFTLGWLACSAYLSWQRSRTPQPPAAGDGNPSGRHIPRPPARPARDPLPGPHDGESYSEWNKRIEQWPPAPAPGPPGGGGSSAPTATAAPRPSGNGARAGEPCGLCGGTGWVTYATTEGAAREIPCPHGCPMPAPGRRP